MRGPAAVLSLALAALLACAWARSYGDPYVLVLYGPGGRPLAVAVRDGIVHMVAGDVSFGPRRSWWAQLLRPQAEEFDRACNDQLANPDGWHHGSHGILIAQAPQPWADDATFVATTAPSWFVMPVLLVLPARHGYLTARATRRLGRGMCRRCGYDRRGLPRGGRCPECGATAG